jgi:hypothetical protein
MDEKPKPSSDIEFVSVVLAIIWLPAWAIIALSGPSWVVQAGAAVAGAYSIWVLVRKIARRNDPRHAKRPTEPP